MKILLIGATGQLGADIQRNNPGHEIIAPGRDQLDLANLAQVESRMQEVAPDTVINCAAFHNVPQCEEQPEQAFLVNCVAVGKLALLCRIHDAQLVTFSSDYVFGGESRRVPYLEEDPPRPLQIYGISRAAGEYAALSAAPDHAIIVRTCGLYGRSGSRSKGGNFVDNRVADGRGGRPPLEMASEQIVCPTSTDDLSRAVLQLAVHPGRKAGIYHLVNEGECSWYELTRAIYDILGLNAELRPVDRHGRTGNMRRPLYSVLANAKARELGITLRPWRQALQAYLSSGG